MDLVLGDLRDQRRHRADDVRRLEGAPHRQLALDLVEGGDALAGLERAGMDALIGDQLLDRHFRLLEGRVRRLLVAHLPGEDVIVVLALAVGAVGLVLDVLAQDGRARRHRLEGIDEHGQLLVLDLDQLGRVGRHIAVLRDDEGDFLVLVQHLLLGQHRRHVAGQGRHVVQAERLQVGGRQHGQHARQRLRLRGIDLLDPRMAVGRAREVAIDHARQFQVVDIVALALDEADVLDALALAAHALELLGALFLRRCHVVHSAASLTDAPESLAAAY